MRTWSLVTLVATLGVISPACRSAEISVHADLAGRSPALAVTGHSPRSWGDPVSFGPYQTSFVESGDQLGWMLEAFGVTLGVARRPTRLVLNGDAEGTTAVECLAERFELGRSSFLVDLGFGTRPLLACGLESEDGSFTLTLVEKAPRVTGELRRLGGDGRAVAIRSVHRLAGAAFDSDEAVGWELVRDDQVIAAVETVNAGRVWIDPALPAVERQRLAATAAALLLFEPPSAVD